MDPVLLPDNGKKDHRFLAFVLVTLLLVAAALCPVAAAARDVRVGLHELPPSLFTNDQGQPDGIFVDLIRDIAAKQGWNLIWVHGTLQENFDRLARGDIDLMMGVVDTPEREKLYDFNREQAVGSWLQVYTAPGSDINTILELDGKRVAVLRGDANAAAFRDTAQKFAINVTYVEEDTLDDVFRQTAAGNADAAVAFRLAGQGPAQKYHLSDTPIMLFPSSLGFAVPKGRNADLLAAIDRYLAEGKSDPSSFYSQTMQKWLGEKAGWVTPPWLLGGLGTVAIVAVLFVAMNVFLRREVRRKTAELSLQNRELFAEVANRRRAEEELADEITKRKILVDQSRDGIVVLDQEGRVYEANQRFADMLGYSREEMQQLTVLDWDAQIRRDRLEEMIRTVDARGDHFETRHRRKDGSVIDVEISTNAAEFSGRKLIFCVVRDTSERKKAAEQLQTVNAYLQTEVANRTRAESELVRKNEELNAAYGQLAAAQEDLKENYRELTRSERALMQARKKLSMLNTLTFQDIQSGIFSLAGFISLAKNAGCSGEAQVRLGKGEEILHGVERSLAVSRKYQSLGLGQARWQSLNYVMLSAISHLDLSRISRKVEMEDIEIYADPLLEDVFVTLMENVIAHGEGATEVRISCRQNTGSITILVLDNGPGIPAADKERIFTRDFPRKGSTSLFFAREILSITDIMIAETGEPGRGARFEITVPAGAYRPATGRTGGTPKQERPLP